MHLDEFENGCQRLIKWFKKPLDDYQVEHIYNAVSFVPFIAWNDMVSKIIESSKPVASNFPTITELKQKWYEWRKENPHRKVAQFQQTECRDCESTGILFFKVRVKGAFPYQYAVKCGSCQNWRMHWGQNVPTAELTRDYIIGRGWELQREVRNPLGGKPQPVENLTKDMLTDVKNA